MIVKENKDEFYQYTTDQANLSGACDKVFIVKNSQEVREVVLKANKSNTPLTVCGNHTSLTGSSLPYSGWVISTEELNEIIEINEHELFAIVEPGITLKSLQQALAPFGLFFPPDPTEDSCFIGGMIGTNASGARSYKYGSVRNFTLELDLVLPDGSNLILKRGEKIDKSIYKIEQDTKEVKFNIPESYVLPDVKNSVGYYLKPNMDSIDLFIGAEGTLGIITKVRLKLQRLPKYFISIVVFFDSVEGSFNFLTKLKTITSLSRANKDLIGINARSIEFYDFYSLKLLGLKYHEIPNQSKAAYWIEQECFSVEEYNNLLISWELFLNEASVNLDNVWFGSDEKDRQMIIGMRHTLPMMVNDIVKKNKMKKIGTDVAVPNKYFQEFYNNVITIVEESKIEYVAFGHFGDSHLHLNLLPSDLNQSEEGYKIYNYICIEAIRLGGTFSAEHGVGKLKKQFVLYMFNENSIKFLQSVKQLLDPKLLLNKGNLIDI